MSKSLLTRIEALEKARGLHADPLCIIFSRFSYGDTLRGYSWGNGQTIRQPGESDEALLDRAQREAMTQREPWGFAIYEMREP